MINKTKQLYASSFCKISTIVYVMCGSTIKNSTKTTRWLLFVILRYRKICPTQCGISTFGESSIWKEAEVSLDYCHWYDMRIYSIPTQLYNVFFFLRPVLQKGISASLWILIFYHLSQKGAKNETVSVPEISIKVWRVAVIAENCSQNLAVQVNVYIVKNRAK